MNTEEHLQSNGNPHSDTDYWYIWNETKPLGPMFFSRLKQMAHKGELLTDAKVRMGNTGEWIFASSITDLEFPDAVVLTSPKRTQSKEVTGESSSGLLWTIRDWIVSPLEGIQQLFVNSWQGIRTILSWAIFITVFVSLGVILVQRLSWDTFHWTNPSDKYQAIWNELKEKRKAHASTEKWDEFATRVNHELVPIVARLERSAGPENHLSQQLLWAGRDYLPKMLADARTDESESERKFGEHLQRANRLKDGLDLNGMRQRAPLLLPWGMISDFMIVLGVIFAVVDLWGIVWFARKWLRRKTQS